MGGYKLQYRIQFYMLLLLTLSLAVQALGNLASNLSCTSNCSCEHVRNNFVVKCRQNSDVNEDELSEKLDSLLPLYSNLTYGGFLSLTIVDTPLKHVPRSICHLTTLRFLYLDNNQLTGLPDDCFPHLKRLVYLSATGNKIEMLQDGLFDGLQELYYLNFSGNQISEIGLRVFSNETDMISLRRIDLSHNNLTTIEPWPFIRARHGTQDSDAVVVDLRNNHISTSTNEIQWRINCSETPGFASVLMIKNKIRHIMDIKEGWNFPFSQLYCLFGYSTVIIAFDANPFACDCIDYFMYKFLNEAELRFYNDPLFNCYCSADSPFPNTKVKKVPLDQLVCQLTEHCPLGCQCVYRPANAILHVDCSNANFSILPSKLPQLPESSNISVFNKYVTNTKYKLDFSNNRYLRRLDHQPYFVNTSILDVSNCGIDELPLSIWKDISVMKKVTMDGNSLTSLPEGLETVPLTASMSFGRNQWECSCKNRWMSGWLRSVNHSLENIYGFLCASPKRLRGKSIARISEEEFCHDPANAERKRATITNVASVVGVAVFLLIPMIIILIVYRLRIKLYTRFKFHPFDRDECDGEDMDFDVFLSCFSDDNVPHGNGIREQLEERGYRVCYPPRNFLPGESICQNIYNAVVRSKRTVCLLTPHFLQSPYCMFEFDTAHHHNIAVKRKKRLLVLMALDNPTDLYDNDAPDTVVLRQYLRQYTYVDYRADDWLDKLLYALPLHGMDEQREEQEPGNFENYEAMVLE